MNWIKSITWSDILSTTFDIILIFGLIYLIGLLIHKAFPNMFPWIRRHTYDRFRGQHDNHHDDHNHNHPPTPAPAPTHHHHHHDAHGVNWWVVGITTIALVIILIWLGSNIFAGNYGLSEKSAFWFAVLALFAWALFISEAVFHAKWPYAVAVIVIAILTILWFDTHPNTQSNVADSGKAKNLTAEEQFAANWHAGTNYATLDMARQFMDSVKEVVISPNGFAQLPEKPADCARFFFRPDGSMASVSIDATTAGDVSTCDATGKPIPAPYASQYMGSSYLKNNTAVPCPLIIFDWRVKQKPQYARK